MTCLMTLAFIHLLPSVVQSPFLSECIKGGADTLILSNDMQQSSQAARCALNAGVVLLSSLGGLLKYILRRRVSPAVGCVKFHFLVLPLVCLHDRERNLLG